MSNCAIGEVRAAGGRDERSLSMDFERHLLEADFAGQSQQKSLSIPIGQLVFDIVLDV